MQDSVVLSQLDEVVNGRHAESACLRNASISASDASAKAMGSVVNLMGCWELEIIPMNWYEEPKSWMKV